MLDVEMTQDRLALRKTSGDLRPSLNARLPVRSLATTPPEIVLDISRLISRVRFSAPTGVDRVEMAYAQQLLTLAPDSLKFAAVHPSGVYGRLPDRAVVNFLNETLNLWSGARLRARVNAWTPGRLAALLRLTPNVKAEPLPVRNRPRVYLQVSPHHLDQPRTVGRILAREQARFVCLVHDLIPIEYPEYARPNGLNLHKRRMDTVARFADAVIAASETTKRSLATYAGLSGRSIDIRVSPLGAEPADVAPSMDLGDTPYFVSVGTIEPRKNHLLLLNLWRRMVEEIGPGAAPRLILIGRRGWENEGVVDMLDRCLPLRGIVEERGHVPDREMWRLLLGSRALLMPSFVEGFGLPVIEALKLGVPVLCSDISAHREIAEPVAEFLDPLDGPKWREAIFDYSRPGSARRMAQVGRMPLWQAPTWEDHVQTALQLIRDTAQ